MNRLTAPTMIAQTARRIPADGGHILVPFPGTTVVTSISGGRPVKQGK